MKKESNKQIMQTSKMRVLFINPNLHISKDFIDYPYLVNINMLQAVSYLKKNSISVDVIDMFSQEDSDVFDNDGILTIGSKKDIGEMIGKKKFNAAIILNTPFLKLFSSEENKDIQRITKAIKSINKKAGIILADCHIGGMHYVEYNEKKIKKKYPLIDHICRYECERSLIDLLKKDVGSNRKESKRKEKIDIIKDLDTLPFPDYQSISMDSYSQFLKKVSEKGYSPFLGTEKCIPIFTSRGCIYSCNFCSSGVNGRFYREYSIGYIGRHLQFLKKKFKVNKIIILDELANPTFKRIEELIQLLDKLKLSYEFPNGLRADNISKKNLKMMKGNISSLTISAESGNDRILNYVMKKRLRISSVKDIAKQCKKLGIPLNVHFMIGIKGENIKDINNTLYLAWSLTEKYNVTPLIQITSPIPGSKLFDSLSLKANEKKDIYDNYMKYFMSPNKGDYSKKIYSIPNEDLGECIYNFNKKLESTKFEKIIINVTYKCNNNCVFCAVGNWRSKKASFDVQKKKLDEAYDKGVRMVDFDGGEPTIDKNIFKLIRHAKELGYNKITLVTNGRMLSVLENTSKLFDAGITSLVISLHGGDSITHESITRSKGSFRQTLEGIKNSVMVNKQNGEKIEIAVNITLTNRNINTLNDFLELVYSIGIKKVNIQFMTPFGLAKNKDNPEISQIYEYLPKAIVKYGKKLKLGIINLPFCFLKGYEGYLMNDIYKSKRNMVFIGKDEENIAEYLSKKRYKDNECSLCVYSIICNGKYKKWIDNDK